ncbi:RHS repeat-associated core domain-containing protein [Kitasatospora azatica]|uniref:RHS repeat-associated core domain-containing protein n=1 Tax=Kitasatospora azatica TaxID=58347 RepID=UPI00056D5934|nr:RHS repeat-associated core domain-containing protein [Kitasatospora azatica]
MYQAADPHGTTGVQIDTGTAQNVTRRPTDPFGNPRGSQPAPGSWSGDKGFVGGTLDTATGLTDLGAREYDPLHGRFLNPDPLLDLTSPQQWNGYAYSDNHPVSSSDPSGLIHQADFYSGGAGDGTACDATCQATLPTTSSAPMPDTSGFGQPAHPTTPSNGGGKGGNGGGGWLDGLKSVGHAISSGAKAVAHGVETGAKAAGNGVVSGAKWAWDHRADIGQAIVETVVYSGCIGGSLAGAAETGGASLLAVAGCGAVAGAAGAATYDLLSPDAPSTPGGVFKDIASGAAFGAVGAVIGEGASYVGKKVVQKAAPLLGDAADWVANKLSKACANSFPAGTLVLLADGSTKAINTVAVGDQVASADPQTGQSNGEPVTQTIVTPDDQAFTDLTFAPDAPNAAATEVSSLSSPTDGAVTSTQHHPFWDVTAQRWTNAADLRPGDRIAVDTAAGTATVTSVRSYRTDPETAYNLTVDELHTYYVVAGGTPVLVHNDACPYGYHVDGDPDCECQPPVGGTAVAGTRQPPQEAPWKGSLKKAGDLVGGLEKGASELHAGTMHSHDFTGTDLEHPFADPYSTLLITGLRVGTLARQGAKKLFSRRDE